MTDSKTQGRISVDSSTLLEIGNPGDASKHRIEIEDDISRKSFEELLGLSGLGDHIIMTHRVYKKHAAAINAIQFSSAFRFKCGISNSAIDRKSTPITRTTEKE